MLVNDLELDLDVFSGPFDLMLALILREEIDLMEVELASVIISYIDHLERRGQLDLEVATEFLVLIAALLELKSRMLLPQEESEDLDDLTPQEAAEELLARILDHQRYQGAANELRVRLQEQDGYFYRSAPLPQEFRDLPLQQAGAVYKPERLGRAIGGMLRMPEQINLGHVATPRVTVAQRLTRLRSLLKSGSFSFDKAVVGADRMTVAVTLYALLELYKVGEAQWQQQEPFAEITVAPITERTEFAIAA